MFPLQFPGHEKYGVNRENEDSLELEAESNRGEDDGGPGPVGHCTVDPQKKRGNIEAVTLPPDRTVQKHRGEKERCKESGKKPWAALCKTAAEKQNAPGEQKIRECAQKLDQVEIIHRQHGEQGQKIQIGDVVIADGVTQRLEPAVLPEKIHPSGEKVDIIQSFIIKCGCAQSEGQGQQQNTDDPRDPCFQNP